MIILFICGVVVAAILNLISDYAPRFAVEPLPTQRTAPYGLSLWQLVVSPLRGRRISGDTVLHAAAEVVTGGLFAAVWAHRGASLQGFTELVACSFFVLISLIDIKHRLVLNAMVFPMMMLIVVYTLLRGNAAYMLVGGVFAFTIFFVTEYLMPGKVGSGDTKLAALLGLAFGFPTVLWVLLLGIGIGGVIAAWLLAARRGAAMTVPYAPFLCAGAVIALFFNPVLFLVR